MAEAMRIYSELRQPLRRTGAVLGGLLLLMAAAGAYSAHVSRLRLAAEQRFQGTVQDYRAALESERILRTDAERFMQLRAQGFIGPEPRLRWIEDVRAAAAQASVGALRYELEPRSAHAAAVATGSFQLFSSRMRLQLELRHEGELITFLRLLEARRGGLFEPTACTLRRPRDAEEIRLHEANFKGDCELRWYTLAAPDAAAVEDSQ